MSTFFDPFGRPPNFPFLRDAIAFFCEVMPPNAVAMVLGVSGNSTPQFGQLDTLYTLFLVFAHQMIDNDIISCDRVICPEMIPVKIDVCQTFPVFAIQLYLHFHFLLDSAALLASMKII